MKIEHYQKYYRKLWQISCDLHKFNIILSMEQSGFKASHSCGSVEHY